MKKDSAKVTEALEDFSPESEEIVSSISEKVHKSQKSSSDELSRVIIAAIKEYQDRKTKDLQAKFGKEIDSGLKKIKDMVDDLKADMETDGEGFEQDFEDVYEQLDSLESLVDTAMDMAVELSEQDSAPKFEGVEKKITDGLKAIEERLDNIVKDTSKHTETSGKNIKSLEGKVELLSKDNKVHYKSKKEVGKQVLKLEEELKKLSKSVYEFGSSFSVLSNGSLIGATFGINFKNGTNTTVSVTANTQGFIDIAINAASGGSFSGTQEKSTNAPDGSTQVFNFAHPPKLISWNGSLQTLTDDYTVTGADQITFTGTQVPQVNDKIVNIYA